MSAGIHPRADQSQADKRAVYFAATFVALALAGVALLLNRYVDQNIVTPFTRSLVDVCAALINMFGDQVAANGSVLSFIGAHGAVEVANGCNAVEVSLLLGAAIAAFPASISARALGVLACVGVVQAINLARIISLLFLARYAPGLFEFFHLYVWDAVIVLDGVLIFFLWTRRYARASSS